MPGTWFGFPTDPNARIDNPVGKTGMIGGIAGLVGSIASMLESDPSPTNIATAVVSVLVFLFGDRVRRQPGASS